MTGGLRLLGVLLAALPGGCAWDPAPGLVNSRASSRNLECTRLNQAEAHQQYPGVVPDLPPRELAGRQSNLPGSNVDALICATKITEPGDRPARDEAILTSLRQTVGELTRLASALGPEQTRWHVDAFYPEPTVAQKISVAAKTDLAERGYAVSDRVPVLAAGDIAVLARLPAQKAYPLACRRYFAQKAMVEPDAFLGLMILDARETELHAGVCVHGEWTWLR